ncbi:DUF6455 family protein [Salipiger sp. H15]|uniref:DUF6455 family protein n=1 Tax=Alloyangia sp. H15 TaxID=3029062 RepID=A0AAU8AI03_9RHOB
MISASLLNGPRPHPLGGERAHYWRVQRMARATGVDLAQAQRLGMLAQPDWAGMVLRCRGCLWTEECDHWLTLRAEVSEESLDGQDAPRACPEDCANRPGLAALQDRLGHEV